MILFPQTQTPPALPFLSPALGSHMVLQRGRPNTFWGWTTPSTSVTVAVAGRRASGVAGRDGKWSVRLLPPGVGGPYTITVDGTQHLELTDVLVGDVWLCTGQSNMEQGITLSNGAPEEIARANDPGLRLFIAPQNPRLTPQKVNGGEWRVTTPETIVQGGWGGFSAVGYHFGKTLRRNVGVPIGLVQDVWGGTNAESWVSREGLRPLKDFDPWFPRIDAAREGSGAPGSNDPGSQPGVNWGAMDLDTSAWKSVAVPNGFSGLGLGNYDGTAWFRREFTLTEAQAAGGATLSLGAVDDYDVTWLNGAKIGAGTEFNVPRSYTLASGALRAGRNVLAVRVLDTGGGGGFSSAGPPSLALADGTQIPLAGDWLGRVGAPLPIGGPNVPTSLSNGMIEPEVPLAIRGAIWYQGENNAGRAEQYRRLLPTLIADWRRRFGQGDFPFYIVSLAAFTPHKELGVGNWTGDDEWAELREAQAMTASKVKNAGLALAIDIGDERDIHPREKRTVGERLARVALAKEYARRVPYSGPTYRAMKVAGSAARLSFDQVEGGLSARGGAPGEFMIAGADRKWHAAMAVLDGDTVVVSSPQVARPVAVRYAWQSNPVANLYNGAGLPAVPFRTDSWPGITTGRK